MPCGGMRKKDQEDAMKATKHLLRASPGPRAKFSPFLQTANVPAPESSIPGERYLPFLLFLFLPLLLHLPHPR